MSRVVQLAGIVCTLAGVGNVHAGIITICSDKQPILDFPDCPACQTLPAKLPVAMFSFAGQPKLDSITGIHFDFTMQDGDTAVGEMDYNNLTLALDTVDTGLKLNGFKAGAENTLRFEWTGSDSDWPNQAKVQALIQDVFSDGMVTAAIIDHTPNDNFVNLYSALDTQLCLTGNASEPVPEPASLALWCALGSVAVLRRRLESRTRR